MENTIKIVKVWNELGCGSLDGDISVQVNSVGGIVLVDDNGAGEPNVIFVDPSSIKRFARIISEAAEVAKQQPEYQAFESYYDSLQANVESLNNK